MTDPRIIIALDYNQSEKALALAEQLDPQQCRLKVGKQLFTAAGPQLVEKLMRQGFEIFLDLKFHDIPNTVAGACKAAASLGVWMINVHAFGGRKMLLAAREATPAGSTKLVAVTLLTSIGSDDLAEIGLMATPENIVKKLALLAQDCGLDGVVCSPLETTHLRKHINKQFCLVTPGIRPVDASIDDQQRIATPQQAIENGADYLVIGRPVTQALDPLQALQRLNDAIKTHI